MASFGNSSRELHDILTRNIQIPAAPETNKPRLIPDLHATSINFEANQVKNRRKKNYIRLFPTVRNSRKREQNGRHEHGPRGLAGAAADHHKQATYR